MSESEALHKFIYGLKAEIKSRILVANPSDLNEAMQQAQALDDVIHPRNPYARRPVYRFGRQQDRRTGIVPMDLDVIQEQHHSGSSSHPKRRGNCHNCGKPGHWASECPYPPSHPNGNGNGNGRKKKFFNKRKFQKPKHSLRQAEDLP